MVVVVVGCREVGCPIESLTSHMAGEEGFSAVVLGMGRLVSAPVVTSSLEPKK